ncbi:MAG TPA: YhdH/YhfP family quinone oxidoreductase [Gammaproteobacteria bacterium]|nr:YhdH/YhfP family quinone oxidoreductase [Gammaproteobacteria bacterium]
MAPFRACVVRQYNGRVSAAIEEVGHDFLGPGDVLVEAHYSSVNYKDALAATGRGKIIKHFPLIAGVDVAGVVASSSSARFSTGDPVIVTGCGLGERHHGGFAEFVRVPADWVVPLPADMSLYEAMALGTAGFTAALAIDRMEQNGQHPGLGPILVSGATGGVGSLAVDLLNGRGYSVTALTGKPDAAAYLERLGADRVLERQAIVASDHPLRSVEWGGAVDNVGGTVLAWLLQTVGPWGSIATIGMAGGSALHTTVMPMILRGVSMLGITSANCPMVWRPRLWNRLASDLRPAHLSDIVTEMIRLEDLPRSFEALLEGKHAGRFVVALQGE